MGRYFKSIVLSIATLFAITIAMAQDGGGLFKAKCSICHMLDKNSTGPFLKGVKQKWEVAGEGLMIYDWVKNPQNLVASGKSKMAIEAEKWSPTAMTPQEVSNKEVDAILFYVDNYVKPEPATAPLIGANSANPIINYRPNYKDNLTKFYWLLFLSVILFFSIFLLSNSIKTLIKSDAIKKKLMEGEKKEENVVATTSAFLVGTFGLMALNNNASAFTYNGPGVAEEGMPWLLIENSDLYVLIVVDIILLGVLWYLRGLFSEFMGMLIPEKLKIAKKGFAFKKLNKVLTDIAEIQDEESILMEHEYDGIRELDNNLPPWWVWMFYATIIFSVVYLFNYHVFGTADLQIKAYEKDMAKSKKEVDAYLSKMAMNVDETNVTALTDAADINSGKGIFEVNCVSCHNPNGEGNIGPNLTDKFWLNGHDIKDLFKIVKLGNANGMPEHASKLNPVQIQQVTSFVLRLPNRKGKEPQGIEVKY